MNDQIIHFHKAEAFALGSLFSSLIGIPPFVWLQIFGILVPIIYYLILIYKLLKSKPKEND